MKKVNLPLLNISSILYKWNRSLNPKLVETYVQQPDVEAVWYMDNAGKNPTCLYWEESAYLVEQTKTEIRLYRLYSVDGDVITIIKPDFYYNDHPISDLELGYLTSYLSTMNNLEW